jgi:hypothetical protein
MLSLFAFHESPWRGGMRSGIETIGKAGLFRGAILFAKRWTKKRPFKLKKAVSTV